MKRIKMSAMAVPLALIIVTPAAAETFHGYAVQEHYVINGGEPASIEQIANKPMSVFRSELAYANFRAHLSGIARIPVTEENFGQIMLTRVRPVDCLGTIDTSGVTDSGRFAFKVRTCYTSPKHGIEKLLQYRLDDGRWVTFGSQWCYNPVRGEVPEGPPPTYSIELPPAPLMRSYTPENPTVSDIHIDIPSMGSTVLVIGIGGHRHKDDCPPDHE